MNTPTTRPPTAQEVELAHDIISRSVKARKESGEICPDLLVFKKQREKNKALAAECETTALAMYQRLLDALPEDHKDLFGQYSLLVIAPYEITQKNFKMFESINRRMNKLLAALKRTVKGEPIRRSLVPQKAGAYD